jgi:4-hydroxy-tetrahydrodipicolinate synthase
MSVDYEVLEKYLTVLYRQGARRFYAMAYNSRYSQLTHAEILDLNEFCIRTVKRLDRDNIVIVGDPIHCSTRRPSSLPGMPGTRAPIRIADRGKILTGF